MNEKKKWKKQQYFFFFFGNHFSSKWSSNNFKWKPSLWIHWWLLRVVTDCKAISNAEPLPKNHKEGQNGLRQRFDFTNESSFWSWTDHLCYFLPFSWKEHEILLQRKSCLYKSRQSTILLKSRSFGNMFGLLRCDCLESGTDFVMSCWRDNMQLFLSWDSVSGVNPALLPLRWSNSRHSGCHSSWQAVYLENSI